ncbi:MAG: adenylate/guanylate cyclase domain-containing protein [Pseudomonadota bacterium]
MERRLATIVAADIAGFSRLIGADEEGTLRSLREIRSDSVAPLLKEHNGRIANTAGDSLLIEFSSTVEALRFSIALQERMARRNYGTASEQRIAYRIGINVGDVVADGEDLLGDGVNVAARLEALAPVGGIVISRSTRDQVRDRVVCNLADLGKIEVKNIARPVHAFQVLGGDEAPLTSAKRPRRLPWVAGAALIAFALGSWAWWRWTMPDFDPADQANYALPLPEKPSIAVLAFDNLSGDHDQEFLADGISEDITAALARIPQLFVIARNSAFTYKGRPVNVQQVAEELGVRYILEGSVQRDGEQLRVTAQLIDALGGNHIWSQKHDREMTDLFAVKDEIALRIAESLHVELARGDTIWSRTNSTNNIDAWLLSLEGWAAHEEWTQAGNARAQTLNARALELEPNSAQLTAALGWRYFMAARFQWASDTTAALTNAVQLAKQSEQLDPEYAGTYALMNAIHLYKGAHAAAIEAGLKATQLAPNDSDMLGMLGLAQQKSMDVEQAISNFEKAVRLNPHTPQWMLENLGESYVIAGAHEKAIPIFKKLLTQNPKGALAGEVYINLAVSLDALGNEAEARDAISKAIDVYPRFTTEYLRGWALYSDAAYTDRWLATLKRLGLPDS